MATCSAPWAQIHAAYHQSRDALCARLDSFSSADLTEPNRFPRMRDGAPLESVLLANSYTHPIAHLAELVAKYDSPAAALRLQKETAHAATEFDANPRNRDAAIYNLACAYALNDNVTRAVELLREAFALRPDLLEFSKTRILTAYARDLNFNRFRCKQTARECPRRFIFRVDDVSARRPRGGMVSASAQFCQ